MGAERVLRHRELTRRERRALRRQIERRLRSEGQQRERALSRRQRRRVAVALAAFALGALSPRPGDAAVRVTDDVDFVVEIDAGEGVAIECSPNGQVRVIVDGASTDYGTACADVLSLQVLADADPDPNTLDLSGVLAADFSSPAILVDGGGGDDTLLASAIGDTLSAGDGDDTLLGGPKGDTLIPGPGADTIFDGAGADVIQVLPGSVADTLHVGDGADTLSVALGVDTDVLIDDVSGDGVADTLSIVARDVGDTISLTDTDVFLARGGAVQFSGMEQLTLLTGDEVGSIGDTLYASISGGIDVLLDGGAPTSPPGDTLFLSGSADHVGFESVVLSSGVPSVGWRGMLALAASLLGASWAGLRSRPRGRD